MLRDITNTINNKITQNGNKKQNEYDKCFNSNQDHNQLSKSHCKVNKGNENKDKAFEYKKSLKPIKQKEALVPIIDSNETMDSSTLISMGAAKNLPFIHPCLSKSKNNNEVSKLHFINKQLKNEKLNPYNSETNKKSDFILNKKRSYTSISNFTPNSTTKYYHSNIAFNSNANANAIYMKVFKEDDVMRHNSSLKSELILNSFDEDITTDEESINQAIKLTIKHLREAISSFNSAPQNP